MKNQTAITKKLNLIFNKIDFKSTPKMGGIQKLTCKEVSIIEDTKEFYSGRGSKYNKNINHSFEEITITQKLMNDLVREQKLILKNGKIEWKKRQEIELKNKCDGFSAKLKNDEIIIYNVIVFDLEKIALKISELSGEKVLASHIKNNYDGWKSDYKTYTNVNNTHRLYAPCGCNEFTLFFNKTQCENQWV